MRSVRPGTWAGPLDVGPAVRRQVAALGLVGWSALALVFAGTGCASHPSASEPVQRWQAPAEPELVLQAETKVGGVAAGDLDGVPGDEVVAVAEDGGVWIARWQGQRWAAERIHALEGEAIGVACLPPGIGLAWLCDRGKTKW